MCAGLSPSSFLFATLIFSRGYQPLSNSSEMVITGGKVKVRYDAANRA